VLVSSERNVVPTERRGDADPYAGIPAEVLCTDQVAERLQLGPVTVRALVADGRIPATKVGQEWRYYWPAVVRAIFERSSVDGGTGRRGQRGVTQA
jgi:excisionase family DNA binding protein